MVHRFGKKNRTPGFWSAVAVLVMGTGVLLFAIASRNPAPEAQAQWSQPLSAPPEKTSTLLDSVVNWPRFCPNVRQARLINPEGIPLPLNDQKLQEGSILELSVDPKLSRRSDEEIILEVERPVSDAPVHRFRFSVEKYIPGNRLKLRMILDPTGKISALYSNLAWEVQLIGHEKILLTVSAIPTAWNSRIFAVLLPGPTLRPLAFVDLRPLSAIQNPLGVNSIPQWRR
ncbi:MAG: hypothetical protein JNL01_05790 [Bdellovibrionales bacterium]|nr:hypothetical protein [Bdellovibrionales bacterium]